MNVQQVMEAVRKFVLILLEVTTALVGMDIYWMLITAHVLVN